MTQPSTALEAAKAGGLAVFTAAQNPFIADARKEGVTDGFWLRMNGKSGVWLSNLPDNPELEQGTELVFDIYHAEKIWQGFDDNSKLHTGPKVTILSGANLPDPQPIVGVKWKKNVRVTVATTDGGKQLSLICKADNPYREVLKLVKRYGELFTKFPDPGSKTGYKLPIVRIASVSYDMMAKERKAVIEDGKEIIKDVQTKVTNFREVFTITDKPGDWISQKEMELILASGLEADAEAAAEPAPVDKQIAGPDFAALAAQELAAAKAAAALQQKVVEHAGIQGEIIPPTAKPAGESSFRRNRAGQTGVRTG